LREKCKLQISENKVLSKVSGLENEISEQRKTLHNEKLGDLYLIPCIVKVVKSGTMRWAEPVARMGRQGIYTEFWWGIPL